jgi:hypothetical protein
MRKRGMKTGSLLAAQNGAAASFKIQNQGQDIRVLSLRVKLKVRYFYSVTADNASRW